MQLTLLFAAFVLAVTMNVFGLVVSRGGRSALHSVAFFAGLLGLLAAPVVVFAFFALAAQFILVSASSPAGVTFQVAGAMAVLCGVVSSSAAFAATRRRASQCAV